MSQPLHVKGAHVWDADHLHDTPQRDIYIENGRIVEACPHDSLVVDLEGLTIFPGLVNAHDHLELNHYPRTKFREVYNNAHEWGEDVNVRLDSEPFKSLRAYPITDRLFIGGLKNLLCGATAVVHHGPKYRQMYARDFPVRVLKKYGWAHSLHFNTDEEIVASYQNTPKDWPWFIHLAEGTDDVAAGEYQRLKALGCVGENTVIVHGVGMTEENIVDAGKSIRGLVWCPSTNLYLLGVEYNPKIGQWTQMGGRVAIGNDSRLTADGDFLEEITVAGYCSPFQDPEPQGWKLASSLLGLDQIGYIKPNYVADFYIPPYDTQFRNQVPLIIYDGIPRIGDPEIMTKFPHIETVPAILDGRPKVIHIDLARRIHRCSLKENGLEVDDLPKGKRFWFF